MKKKEKELLKKHFRNAIIYLKESRNYIYAISLIFLLGIIAGFVFSGSLGFLDEFLKELLEKTEGLNAFELILFIFQNNFESAFYGMIFGLVLGIFPIFVSVFNGIVLGYVFNKVVDSGGVFGLWRILPHGIFELPAIFISLALGFKLGMFIFSKDRKEELKERALNSLVLFIVIVIPLLLIAAFIEGMLIFFYK